MAISRLLLTTLLCVPLAACGGKKDDDKKPADTPAPATPQAPAAPAAQTPGGLGGFAGLFGGGARKQAPASKGLFGGGLNLGTLAQSMGGKAAGAPAAPDGKDVAAPAPEAEPARPAAGGEPSCADVASHVATVAKDQLGDDPGSAQQVVTLLAQMCEQAQWPAAARQCVVAARDEASLEKCSGLIPSGGEDDFGGGGDEGDGEAPDLADMMADKPVPSGNADCDAMAGNLVTAMMSAQLAQVPAEQRQMFDQMKYGIQNQIAAMCAQQHWPREAIQCLGQARTEQDVTTCAGKYNLQP